LSVLALLNLAFDWLSDLPNFVAAGFPLGLVHALRIAMNLALVGVVVAADTILVRAFFQHRSDPSKPSAPIVKGSCPAAQRPPRDPSASSSLDGPCSNEATPEVAWTRRALWSGFGVFMLAILVIIGLSIEPIWLAPPHQARAAVPDAVILGASLVLGAVVISAFALLIARLNATTAMLHEVADVRRNLGRAETDLATMRRFRDSKAARV
jgi:hypothetical protein